MLHLLMNSDFGFKLTVKIGGLKSLARGDFTREKFVSPAMLNEFDEGECPFTDCTPQDIWPDFFGLDDLDVGVCVILKHREDWALSQKVGFSFLWRLSKLFEATINAIALFEGTVWKFIGS
jgi:hypothetical protein